MAQEKIDDIVSKKALDSFDQLNLKLDESVANFEKLISKAVDANKALGGAKSFKNLTDSSKELEKSETALAKAKAELLKIQERIRTAQEAELKRLSELEKAKAKLAATETKQAKAVADVNAQTAENNRNLKTQAQLNNAVNGSIEQARIKVKQLTQQRDILNITTEAGKRKQAELNAEIDKYNKFITDNTDKQEKQRRNVGNYSGALVVLEQALQDVKKKMDDFNNTGNTNQDVLKALEKEYELLGQLVNSQVVGFASGTQEVRENQKALQALEREGLAGTEVYNKLIKTTAELADNVGDLKAQIKNLASDTRTLDGLVGSAQLLAGTYAVATESAKLFGVESEDLAKAQQKSQAIIAVLSGLQAIQNALQKESATILFLTEVRTKAVALAQRLYAFATIGATTATRALRAALISTGLGALLVLIPSVVQAMQSFASSASKAREEQEKLNEAIANTNDTIDKTIQLRKQRDADATRADREALALAEARGASEEELFAIKERIAASDSENAAEYLQRYKATEDTVIELQQKLEAAYNQKKKIQQDQQRDLENGNETAANGADTVLKGLDSQIKVIESELNPAWAALKDLQSAQLREEELRNQKSKFFISERQKGMQIERITLQASADAYTDIVENEEKSYAERIIAVDKFTEKQKQILKSQLNEKLLDPSLSNKDKLLAEKEYQQALYDLKKSGGKKKESLQLEEAARERTALIAIAKLELEDRAKANDLIADNEQKSFDDRLDAAYAAFESRQAILLQEREVALADAKLTATERLALEAQYASQLNDLTIDYTTKQLELVRISEEKQTQVIETENQKRLDIIATAANKEVAELNKARIDGAESASSYEQKRRLAESDLRIKEASEHARAEFAKVVATKQGTAEREAAEARLSAATVALGDAIIAKEKEKQAVIVENLQKVQSYSDSVYGLIGGALNAVITAQKNALQEQADQIDINKQKDIDAVNASTESEEKKAARIAIINARAQNQKEAIERRQRRLDQQKAIYDKAKSVIDIILATAVNVAKAITPFEKAYQAAVGAAQLGIALATPIPKYATGTLDHPGGDAIVGDGGRSELAVTPDGRLIKTPAVPTVMNLPKHSIVLPDARAALESGIRSGSTAYQEAAYHYAYMKDMTGQITNELRLTRRVIENKPEVKLVNTGSGWLKMTNRPGGKTEYLNQHLQ